MFIVWNSQTVKSQTSAHNISISKTIDFVLHLFFSTQCHCIVYIKLRIYNWKSLLRRLFFIILRFKVTVTMKDKYHIYLIKYEFRCHLQTATRVFFGELTSLLYYKYVLYISIFFILLTYHKLIFYLFFMKRVFVLHLLKYNLIWYFTV